MWSADTGERITVLDGGHPGPTHCVQFNPKLMMMATACTSMVSRKGREGERERERRRERERGREAEGERERERERERFILFTVRA